MLVLRSNHESVEQAGVKQHSLELATGRRVEIRPQIEHLVQRPRRDPEPGQNLARLDALRCPLLVEEIPVVGGLERLASPLNHGESLSGDAERLVDLRHGCL